MAAVLPENVDAKSGDIPKTVTGVLSRNSLKHPCASIKGGLATVKSKSEMPSPLRIMSERSWSMTRLFMRDNRSWRERRCLGKGARMYLWSFVVHEHTVSDLRTAVVTRRGRAQDEIAFLVRARKRADSGAFLPDVVNDAAEN